MARAFAVVGSEEVALEGEFSINCGVVEGANVVILSIYQTPLDYFEEFAFNHWKARFAPNDSGVDYDLRGAFRAGLTPDEHGHWPDTFKKPNHPTFSVESIYARFAPERAGRWDGERFVPPAEAAPVT